jgi:hypothetical protein
MVLRLDLQAAFADSEISVIKVVEYGCLLPLHSGTAGLYLMDREKGRWRWASVALASRQLAMVS